MTKFKVGYVGNDGQNSAYSFESDRKMIVNARSRGGVNQGWDIGRPWWEDARKAEEKWLAKPDSKMAKHGGIKKYRFVKNLKTGSTVCF